jgi:hypothetical protein
MTKWFAITSRLGALVESCWLEESRDGTRRLVGLTFVLTRSAYRFLIDFSLVVNNVSFVVYVRVSTDGCFSENTC